MNRTRFLIYHRYGFAQRTQTVLINAEESLFKTLSTSDQIVSKQNCSPFLGISWNPSRTQRCLFFNLLSQKEKESFCALFLVSSVQERVSFHYSIIKRNVFYDQGNNSALKCYLNSCINGKLDEINERQTVSPPLINAVREVFNWNYELCVCVRNWLI